MQRHRGGHRLLARHARHHCRRILRGRCCDSTPDARSGRDGSGLCEYRSHRNRRRAPGGGGVATTANLLRPVLANRGVTNGLGGWEEDLRGCSPHGGCCHLGARGGVGRARSLSRRLHRRLLLLRCLQRCDSLVGSALGGDGGGSVCGGDGGSSFEGSQTRELAGCVLLCDDRLDRLRRSWLVLERVAAGWARGRGKLVLHRARCDLSLLQNILVCVVPRVEHPRVDAALAERVLALLDLAQLGPCLKSGRADCALCAGLFIVGLLVVAVDARLALHEDRVELHAQRLALDGLLLGRELPRHLPLHRSLNRFLREVRPQAHPPLLLLQHHRRLLGLLRDLCLHLRLGIGLRAPRAPGEGHGGGGGGGGDSHGLGDSLLAGTRLVAVHRPPPLGDGSARDGARSAAECAHPCDHAVLCG
mmetsp:Transcript_10540/g.26550  ORF Transcript_10540/g.26550 Transcript_10540/m.26550 type:complete len:418 (-) Transcript_10540:43-1296(-)